MIKNFCNIHQVHFGRGAFGRGRRRCYICERENPHKSSLFGIKLTLLLKNQLDIEKIISDKVDCIESCREIHMIDKNGKKYSLLLKEE